MKDMLVYFLLGLAALGLGLGVAASLDLETLCFDRDDKASVSYLYVQEAAGGDIALNEDDTYTLTLSGVSPQTLAFTDRPVRDAHNMKTAEFARAFSVIFENDPPNTELSYQSLDNDSSGSIVLAISSPNYNGESGTVTYQVELVPRSDDQSIDLPTEFGRAHLFIDDGTQTITVSGVVSDSDSVTLPGVTVTAVASLGGGPVSKVTVTDAAGAYEISFPGVGIVELTFQMGEFVTAVRRTKGSQSGLDVTLDTRGL